MSAVRRNFAVDKFQFTRRNNVPIAVVERSVTQAVVKSRPIMHAVGKGREDQQNEYRGEFTYTHRSRLSPRILSDVTNGRLSNCVTRTVALAQPETSILSGPASAIGPRPQTMGCRCVASPVSETEAHFAFPGKEPERGRSRWRLSPAIRDSRRESIPDGETCPGQRPTTLRPS